VVAAVGELEQLLPLCGEVQAASPLARTAQSAIMPSRARQWRRRIGIPNSNRQASAAPPAGHGSLRVGVELAALQDEELLAVVATVIVAFCAVPPERPTGLVVPKLNVGTFTALAGATVTTAPRLTLPVNPASGVTVIVEVAVEPVVTVTFVPEIEKLGPEDAVTVTEPVPDALL
jgi:hypothetical protein